MKEVTFSELVGLKAYECSYGKVICFKIVWKSHFVDKGIIQYWEFRYPRLHRHCEFTYNNVNNIHCKDVREVEYSGTNLIDVLEPWDKEDSKFYLYGDKAEMEREILLEDMTWRN